MRDYTHNGETHCISEWARRVGMPGNTLRYRLRLGLSLAEALAFRPKGFRVDMTGRRFGCWTVLGYAGKSSWHCRCECGRELPVEGRNMRSGKSVRCIYCHLSKARAKRLKPCGRLRLLTFNGRTQHMAAWTRELGWCASTIKNRLDSGWTVEKALTVLPKSRRTSQGSTPAK